jgi:predicted AlkP superfamily phosphohydrolase/phosphomutase
MLTNAVVGGMLLPLYLFVLILQLNPGVPLVSFTSVQWAGAVLAFYVPYVTAVLYFMLLVRDLLAARALRPAWLSVRLLAWLGAGGSAAAAFLMWANLSTFRSLLTPGAAARMEEGKWIVGFCAALLAVVALLRYSFGRRGSPPTAVMLVVVVTISIVGPLWRRGPGETVVPLPRRPPQPAPIFDAPRVRLIAIDGASLGFIRQRVNQLPNFARLIDRGAAIDLATLRPTQTEPVWVAVATGKFAQQNGVRSNAIYRVRDTDSDVVDVLPDYCFAYALVDQGFIRREERSSASLTARPVWEILADYGLASGIVNWPMTAPATARIGYVLSDQVDEAARSPLRLSDARSGAPTTAVDVARETFDLWQSQPWHEVLTTFSRGEVDRDNVNRARWDRAYAETAAVLDQQFAVQLSSVRYEGLDVFGHTHLREAQPEVFGDPRRTSPERSVLDRYYGYLDGEVGAAIRSLAAGDLLLVVSGFGMDPAPLSKRLLARALGEPDWTGTHEDGPDGFLLAYGNAVAQGQIPRGSIVDVAPTILYYFGVPVGRDMDGRPRTDMFAATFTVEHPVKYVSSHEVR